MKEKVVQNMFLLFMFFSANYIHAQNYNFDKNDVNIIGRGQIEWKSNSLVASDCFLALKKDNPEKFEMTILAKGSSSGEQVQAWAGFGFQDRNNRYAVGLRGGNNNDLYLCRYRSDANNKMLALGSLEFEVIPDKWYRIKIVFWDGNIRIYLNDEKMPRIVTKDDHPLIGGSTVIGGGWIPTEFKELQIKALEVADIDQYNRDSLKIAIRETPEQNEAERVIQRKSYQPQKIDQLTETRTEISLNGDWLFKPGYELTTPDKPYSSELDDNDWHIMPVPSFWNLVGNWLHLQDSHLPHKGSGISDNYREKEERRCNAYTFDYTKTTSAWYRHWIEIPTKLNGQKVSLHFEAVSKVAELYVNGNYVGGHVGMFGDFKFDITKHLKPGKNIIAVGVKVRKTEKSEDADEYVGKAVSVDITNDMLNSLPHGMFKGDEGGIWQGVKLVVSNPAYIEDVFAGVRTDGGDFEISINNSGNKRERVEVRIQIVDKQSNETLFKSSEGEHATIKGNHVMKVVCRTGILTPKLWTPEQPNMYKLITSLYKKGKLIDVTHTNIGFRTFEKIGNKFYLNGNPYWLRGANHPPCGIAPNDSKLANTFFKLMHEGNQMITRSHGSPFTKAWMDAADTQGVGVSYEGSWPWLMLGNMPSEELLDIWKNEMLSLVKKYRNHPSLLIWTINNEMYFTMFYHNDPRDIRLKKWKIVSDIIKEIRKLSPNTVISADSGYGRLSSDYNNNLKPNDIDDGDIDDRHIYLNWYNRDFFQIFNGDWAKRKYWSPGANSDRPFFSQEASTGYPNNDDGHFNRKYLFNNYVPQAWIGDWAYEDKDPMYTLQRHAFMTKELMEVIRRTSPESAGLLLFANVCWFKDVYDAEKISPYPVNHALEFAAKPALISAELYGRNFFAGSVLKPRICLVNNSPEGKKIPTSLLKWAIVHNGKVLSSGDQSVGPVNHYERLWMEAEINLPDNLPSLKTNCKLVLNVSNDENVVTENEYDLLITMREWVSSVKLPSKKINVFDLTGATTKVLDKMGVVYNKMKDLTEIRTDGADLLIIANLDQDEEIPYNWEDVKRVCGNGTNVLLLHPGKHLQWLYYDQIESVYERKGRVVNMHVPEHGAFDDIAPLELAWWQQEESELPRACRRSFRFKENVDFTALSTYLRPHTGLGSNPKEYLKEMSGIPLLEIKQQKGRLIASEMETNVGDKDPIAAKLLINLIQDLLE